MQKEIKIQCDKCGNDVSIFVSVQHNLFTLEVETFEVGYGGMLYIIGRPNASQKMCCKECKQRFEHQVDQLVE